MFGIKKVKKFKCVGKVMHINLEENLLQLIIEKKVGKEKFLDEPREAMFILKPRNLDGRRLLHNLAIFYYDSPNKAEIIKSQQGNLVFEFKDNSSKWLADLKGPAVEIEFVDIT